MILRHYGKFKNEEIIVLGYRKSMNSVMICRVTGLPADEQASLRQIASSSYAQSNCDYLIPILGVERHKSGDDWFSYLAKRLHRNDGSVVVLPLKELQEMDEDQKAFFKGWGATVAEAKTVREQRESNQGGGPTHLGDEAPVDYKPINEVPSAVPAPTNEPPVAAVEVPDISPDEAKPYVDREAQMLSIMGQLAQGQAAIAESLAALNDKMAKPARKIPAKKVVRKKAAPKKITAEKIEAPKEEAAPLAAD